MPVVNPFSASTGFANWRVPLPSTASVLKFVDLVDLVGAAVENPHRQVVEARQHHEAVRLRRLGETALCERDVDAGIRVQQQRHVLACAARHALLDLDAGAGEDLDVALRVAMIETVLEAAREHQAARWSWLREPGGCPHDGHYQRQDQRGEPEAGAAREQHEVFEHHPRGRLSGSGNLSERARATDVPVAARRHRQCRVE
jgi:hypothetical protein